MRGRPRRGSRCRVPAPGARGRRADASETASELGLPSARRTHPDGALNVLAGHDRGGRHAGCDAAGPEGSFLENGTGEQTARGLGYFSLGLGAIEIVAPGIVAQAIGMRRPGSATTWMLRAFGMREVTAGLAILA